MSSLSKGGRALVSDMLLLLLLFPVATLAEFQIPEELIEHFDGQKVVLPVKQEVGEELLGKWHNDAHTAVIDCLARERYKGRSKEAATVYEECANKTNTVQSRSRCFVQLEKYLHNTITVSNEDVAEPSFRIDYSTGERVQPPKKDRLRSRRSINAETYILKHDSNESALTKIARSLRKTVDSLFGSVQRSWEIIQNDLKGARKTGRYKNMLKSMYQRALHSKGTKNTVGGSFSSTADIAKGIDAIASFDDSAYKKQKKRKRIRLLSPGIYPEDPDEIAILSPRIPVDSKSPEARAWIEFILSVSGAKSKAEQVLDLMRNDQQKDEPLKLTEEDVEEIAGKKERRKIEVTRKMEQTYTRKQMEEFRNRGFSFMTQEQMNIMYGKESPMHNSRLINEVKHLNSKKMEEKLVRTIRLAANGGRRLREDAILSSIAFTTFLNTPPLTGNTVLTPVFFSAYISAPTVIGPLILSPWIFTPLILSPWIFCPVVLAPFAFAPMILSPVGISVYVLSPGIFSPFILSPLVLVPFVLSPSAGSPLILSPIALSPFVLNPSYASPSILSPSVLSPVLYSPSINSSVILSPSALSPAVESDGNGSDVILSPSI